MGILFIQTDSPGQITTPNVRRVKIISSDNLATVTAAGYLNPISLEGYVIYNTDIIDMWYGAVGSLQSITNPGTYSEFIPAIVNGVITLSQQINGGNVLLPVVNGDLPVFNGTAGQIKDSGLSPTGIVSGSKVVTTSSTAKVVNDFAVFSDTSGSIADVGIAPSNPALTKVVMADTTTGIIVANKLAVFSDSNGSIGADDGNFALHSGNIQAGTVGNTVGAFIAIPSSALGGSHTFQATNNDGTFNVITTNEEHGQGTTNSICDPGFITGFIPTSLITSNRTPVSVFFTETVTLLASDLMSGGHIIVIAAGVSPNARFCVRDIKVCYASSPFDNMTGDRNIVLTDSVVTFGTITAALLKAPLNTPWGSSGNNMPPSGTTLAVISQPGSSIFFRYDSGTMDYPSGNVQAIVTFERVG